MVASLSQAQREELEREFWKNDPCEKPGVFSIPALLNKFAEAPVFAAEVERFKAVFEKSHDMLEIGGGQLWSSCLLKGLYPGARVIGSDISMDAVQSSEMWESIFRVKLDGKIECTSYSIPLAGDSQDLVFAFQAAHHFGNHLATLKEMHRVLRPGGTLLYMAEPVCSRLTYKMAHRRVNRMRPVVHEDLLVLSEMKKLAAESGFELKLWPRAELIHASVTKVVYYTALDLVPALRSIVPNAMSLQFTKLR